jgi:hypothetical protein
VGIPAEISAVVGLPPVGLLAVEIQVAELEPVVLLVVVLLAAES